MIIKNSFLVSYNDGDEKGCGRVQKFEFFGDELGLTIYDCWDNTITMAAQFCTCEVILNIDEIEEIMDRDKMTLEDLSRIKFFMIKYMAEKKLPK